MDIIPSGEYPPQPQNGGEALKQPRNQHQRHIRVALPFVSLGPLKPLQIMLYRSMEIQANVQILQTPVTPPEIKSKA